MAAGTWGGSLALTSDYVFRGVMLLARVDAAEALAPGELRIGRGTLRWLSAAVAVQALALAAIGGTLLLRRPPGEAVPAFRTLTTASAEAPALRVVFAPDTSLAQLGELLRTNRLAVIAGPSDTGIFTLALRSPAGSPQDRQAALGRLRADPRVRFAEPVGGDGSP